MKLETVGRGARAALLVHGNDLGGAFYRPLAERLALHDFATTLVTLPGFAGEPPLPVPSWDALVALVADALPTRATLLGHSMGGLLALLVAARHPDRVARLVLLEPAIFPGRLAATIAARRYLATVVHTGRDTFVNWNGGMRRIADPARFPPAALASYLDARRRADRATGTALFRTLPSLYPLPFAAVRAPTLLVRGARSGWRARLMLARVRVALPHATTATIPAAAHWLANEQDAAVAAAITRFA